MLLLCLQSCCTAERTAFRLSLFGHAVIQMLVQRAWNTRQEIGGTTKQSMKPGAMHPAPAENLDEWWSESAYNRDRCCLFTSRRGECAEHAGAEAGAENTSLNWRLVLGLRSISF
jgi:hypothetical protein